MKTKTILSLVVVAATLGLGCQPTSTEPEPTVATAVTSSYDCAAPYSLPYDFASQDQIGADSFAWQSFLALNAASSKPAWTSWSSTVDLIDCNQESAPTSGVCVCPDDDCTTSGSRYYPDLCQSIASYKDYRVLDQVGKVDDSFLEAQTKGLSAHPVIAANGTFLRYEILVNSDAYDFVVGNGYQQEATLAGLSDPVSFPCADSSAQSAGPIALKLAWMDMSDLPGGLDPSDYYTEDLLVYTPSYRNSTGAATCDLVTMGLVGTHLVRKTLSQPAWVWATFEQKSNAPTCTSLPPAGEGGGGNPGPATSCPDPSNEHNFFPLTCPGGGTDCLAACNTVPAQNPPSGSSSDTCLNPDATSGGQWCLDLPGNPSGGYSRLCRQVSYADYYPGSTSWNGTPPNAACQPSGSIWGKYQLITTQWAGGLGGSTCKMVQATVEGDTDDYPVPTVPVGPDGAQKPYLANTSMESYERSNCMGCHSKTSVCESSQGQLTDFAYWLGLEVPATGSDCGFTS